MVGKKFLVLSFLLLLTGFFIFDHLAIRSFWLDEALVANSLKAPLLKIHTQVIYQNQSILYLYAIKLWSLAFGDSELALRGFSAFFAFLLIILMYFCGRELFKKKAAGLWAAALAATNYFLIWFGTQARPYTLTAFLGLLSYFFLVRCLRRPVKKHYFFYFSALVLSLYTHPWAFLVFFSQIITAVFYFKGRLRLQLIGIQLLSLFLALPSLWVVVLLGQSQVTSWLRPPGLGIFWETGKFLSYGSGWVYLILSFTALFFLAEAKKSNSQNEPWLIPSLLTYFLLPLILAWLVSQWRPAYAVGRYEMIVLPAFLLLLSCLLSSITHRYFIIMAFLLLAGFCYSSVEADREEAAGYQINDRLLAQKLLRVVKAEDTVIATDLSWATFAYYFSHLPGKKAFQYLSYPEEISLKHPCWKNVDLMLEKKSFYEREAEVLTQKLKEKKGAVFVLYKEDNPLNELLVSQLNKHFKLVEKAALPVPRQPMWLDSVLIYQ